MINNATEPPTLTRADMYAEKLLANADRYRDKSVASRDIIDLAMMIGHWGDVPAAAWDKVSRAYGASADRAFKGAIEMVSDRAYLGQCLAKMHMVPELVGQIPAVLRGENSFAPARRLAAANAAAGIAAAARAVYGSTFATRTASAAEDECDLPGDKRPGS